MHSFSWLMGGNATNDGIVFDKEVRFFISFHDPATKLMYAIFQFYLIQLKIILTVSKFKGLRCFNLILFY